MCLYPDAVSIALVGEPIMGKISEIKFYYVEFISSILNVKDCKVLFDPLSFSYGLKWPLWKGNLETDSALPSLEEC